jgi:hypothetical protein
MSSLVRRSNILIASISAQLRDSDISPHRLYSNRMHLHVEYTSVLRLRMKPFMNKAVHAKVNDYHDRNHIDPT